MARVIKVEKSSECCKRAKEAIRGVDNNPSLGKKRRYADLHTFFGIIKPSQVREDPRISRAATANQEKALKRTQGHILGGTG